MNETLEERKVALEKCRVSQGDTARRVIWSPVIAFNVTKEWRCRLQFLVRVETM